MTEDQFRETIQLMEGYWPRAVFKEGSLDVWWSQFQHWDVELVREAVATLARTEDWLPSFAQLVEQYRIEKIRARPETEWANDRRDHELIARWQRVIVSALRDFGNGAPGAVSPVRHAIRRHYRRDGATIVVMSGDAMLRDAEEALAEDAFGG